MAKKRRNNQTPGSRRRPSAGTQNRSANAGRHRRRRKRNLTLHYMILLFFLFGTAAILSFTVLFKIEQVDVVGVDKYTPDEIAAASGVEIEDNLLRINKEKITEALYKEFPYIEEVEIRRKLFPVRVEITVTQSEPVGAILEGAETVLIDGRGRVLERGILLVPDNVLVIKGIRVGDALPGDILGEYSPPKLAAGEELPPAEEKKQQQAEETQERLMMLGDLLEAMEENSFTDLTNVDLTDVLNIRIVYENRITMELGSEAQLKDKLRFMKKMLDEALDPNETGTLIYESEKNRVRHTPADQDPVWMSALEETPPDEENEQATGDEIVAEDVPEQ